MGDYLIERSPFMKRERESEGIELGKSDLGDEEEGKKEKTCC